MDPTTVDSVTDWEPVTGSGTDDLQSLARDEFSGAVTAGPAWAFLLNGRVVGVFDGHIEDFEGTDRTVYRAPDPALPLLYAMREAGGETRGKYYSEETSLREVDRTLSSGNFTGYVELSENVLSGDYYVVYYGGRSMSVAFVGAGRRLITGDEAFDRADDEVGIFSVNAVDVTVTAIPRTERGPADAAEDAAAGAVTDDGVTHDAGDRATDESVVDVDAGTDTDESAQESVTFGGSADDAPRADDTVASDTADASDRYDGLTGGMGIGLNSDSDEESAEAVGSVGEADENDPAPETTAEDAGETGGNDGAEREVDDFETEAVGEDESDGSSEGSDETHTDAEPLDAALGSDAGEPDATADTDAATNGEAPRGTDEDATEATAAREAAAEDAETVETGETVEAAETDADEDAATSAVGRADSGVFTAERQWQQTKRIPALSPDESMERDETTPEVTDESVEAESVRDPTDAPPATEGEPTESVATESEVEPTPDVAALEARLDAVRNERDELEAQRESLEGDLETVTRERDRLRARVADLESELAGLREVATEQDEDGEAHLSAQAAREGTNLFVRYRSKGKPTLKKAQSGDAKQREVVENLRLEYHTTFDSASTTVDGDPYESFLYGTTEWQFTTWVVEELLYEIGRSGHRVDLAPLFDRIPEIDRIEFDGSVAVTVTDAERQKESHESRTFDLVFRDSMGDPLFVVGVDTSRNATGKGAVGSLIEGARAVGESKDTLGGAFYVTTSFFEPEALDAVGEATKSGLLSRNSKKSFVKLSRKQGYHLCLVEARDGEFHLSVPEL